MIILAEIYTLMCKIKQKLRVKYKIKLIYASILNAKVGLTDFLHGKCNIDIDTIAFLPLFLWEGGLKNVDL